MKRKVLISLFILIAYSFGNAQEIEWYSWDEGYLAAKQGNKKMLVFVYADWCHLCNRMLELTFPNDEIAPLINKDFIAIKFNFEKENEKNEIYEFSGNEYDINELIGIFLNAEKGKPVQLGVPLMVFLDIAKTKSAPEMGFKSPADLKPLLKKYSSKI